MFITLLSIAALASCAPDTVKQAPTLLGGLHVAAVHYDAGMAQVLVNGASRRMTESRLAMAFCRWPSLTVAWEGAADTDPQPTSYVVGGTQQQHPDLYSHSFGFELQKRWGDSAIVRPMAGIGVGTVSAEYLYSLRDSSGNWRTVVDGPATATHITSWVGLEVSVFRYVTLYGLAGARHTGRMDLPGIDGTFSGRYLAFGMGMGKFR